MKTKKAASEFDKAVGRKLCMARMMVGLSQSQIGKACGVSFQQVQKYEKGANRIGPERLAIVAKLTGKTVAWFFEEATGQDAKPGVDIVERMLTLPHGVDLARDFIALAHNLDRKVVADVAHSIASAQQAASDERRSAA